MLETANLPVAQEGAVCLTVTETTKAPQELELVYAPAILSLGMGCERGTEPAEAIALAEQVLQDGQLSSRALNGVYSIDLKADERAIQSVADHFGVPTRFFDAARLEAEADRLETPSKVVFAEVGCHGVAEGAALAACGPDGALIVAKQKSKRVTCAIGRAVEPVDPSSLAEHAASFSLWALVPAARSGVRRKSLPW